jgi:nitric oxide dioxygenase
MLAIWTNCLRSQARISSCSAGASVAFTLPLKLQQLSSQQQRSFAANTVYKFSVTPAHIETVKATLPLVANAGTDFTKHFYRRLFAAHPELQNIFNQTNQTLGGQPKKLLKTIAVAAQAAIETGELPGELIEGISQKHCALNLQPEAYDLVGTHLLGTIEDLLTTDKAVIDAWADLYGDIKNVFITRESEIYQETATIPNSWVGKRKFILADKVKLSSGIARFMFEPVDGQPVPHFTPGKYTTVWASVNEEGPYGHYKEQPRHYTLNLPMNDDEDGKYLFISVKKDGLVSSLLHTAAIGSEFELSAPFGCFVMSGSEKLWLASADAPTVFLSAGIGITPGKMYYHCCVN